MAVVAELGRFYQVQYLETLLILPGYSFSFFRLPQELILLLLVPTLHPHGSLSVLCMLESLSNAKAASYVISVLPVYWW